MRNNYIKMDKYRTIQGKNPKNLTGYSQQNDILGKTLNNQRPNISNNPFFIGTNKNINMNLTNININNQNFQNINQNQNQSKSLNYLNHKNMKNNNIFSNTMANNNEILLNPCDSISKEANNISAFSQNPNEQKDAIRNRMYNNFNNINYNKIFTNDISGINPDDNVFNNNSNMNDFNNTNNNNMNMNNNNMNNNMNVNNNDFFNNMNNNNMNNNMNVNNNGFFNNNNMNVSQKVNNSMNINNNMNNNNMNIDNINNNFNNNNMNNNMNNMMNINNNNMINPNLFNNNMNNFNNNNIINPQNIMNNPNPNMIDLNNNKDKIDQKLLDDICNTTVVKHSNYYDYVQSDTSKHLNELLKNMDSFGDIIKKKIEQERLSNPNKFISINEALSFNLQNELKRQDYYVCSLLKLALESQGCTCEIERDYATTENEKKEFYTAMQFITNGMYKFKKYIFTFDFGEERNLTMLNNSDEQEHFNEKLQYQLKALLKIKSASKNIIITNPREGPYIITAIIKQSNFNELNEEQIFNSLKHSETFNMIQKVEKTILLNGCKLNRVMFDQDGDNFGNWGIDEKRGGKDYIPPIGWMGYGLRVLDRYDNGNNDWIDYNNNPDEWAVAYHGMGIGINGDINNNNLKYKKSKDIYHQGQKVEEGIYMTQDPSIIEQYCSNYDLQGKKYKIAIMCRIMPEKIRCPEEEKNFWVINGTENEVRPYRILIKEIV